jgi:hypothetical protein
VSLTPEQRRAALEFLSERADDERLAGFVWQTNYMEDASSEVNEISAIHCDTTVSSSAHFVDCEDAERSRHARSNVDTYGRCAQRLRSKHLSAEMAEVSP